MGKGTSTSSDGNGELSCYFYDQFKDGTVGIKDTGPSMTLISFYDFRWEKSRVRDATHLSK